MPRPTKFERTITFVAQDADRFSNADDNACAVIAAAVVVGKMYSDLAPQFEKLGRVKGQGTPMAITEKVLRSHGKTLKKVDPRSFTKRYPAPHNGLQNVTSHHPDRFAEIWADGKTYLFRTKSHIFAVVNGVNHDWTRSRKLRVLEIYEVK